MVGGYKPDSFCPLCGNPEPPEHDPNQLQIVLSPSGGRLFLGVESPAVPQADGADDFVDGEDETPEAERERRIAEMEEHLYDRLEAKRYGY